jgi:seryl-tRNA(Sec) selenium transferase
VGTGVRVKRIVAFYKLGFSPEQIADKYGHINLAQVHAALAYYYANRDEIEASLAMDDRAIEALEREQRAPAQHVVAS